MKRLVFTFLAAWVLFLGTPLAQGEGPIDETRIALRSEFLQMINHDRAVNGLAPVELDPEAASIADSYCRQQIRYGTTGHFTVDGLSPYMRYSLAGGNDGISENAAAWSATYKFSDRALYDMIRRSEEAMIHETPPHDGHRRAILDPYATHVGIGLAWDRGEFRLTQEFIRRYVSWKRPLPRSAAPFEQISATGKPLPGYHVEAISVHHEAIPQPLAAPVANRIDSYSLPDKRRDYLPRLRGTRVVRRADGAIYEVREEYADGRHGDFSVSRDGSFTFGVPLIDGPGIYTVVVWVRRPGDPAPTAASNISIRVDRPANGFAYAGVGTR
jgi:uncharacterized protein YkwD